MERYRLDPNDLPRLPPEEEQRLDAAPIDYSDIPDLTMSGDHLHMLGRGRPVGIS